MPSLEEMVARLEALRKLRAAGTRRVTHEGVGTVEYRSDAELDAAIRDVEGQIAAASRPRVTAVRIVPSKGLT